MITPGTRVRMKTADEGCTSRINFHGKEGSVVGRADYLTDHIRVKFDDVIDGKQNWNCPHLDLIIIEDAKISWEV